MFSKFKVDFVDNPKFSQFCLSLIDFVDTLDNFFKPKASPQGQLRQGLISLSTRIQQEQPWLDITGRFGLIQCSKV